MQYKECTRWDTFSGTPGGKAIKMIIALCASKAQPGSSSRRQLARHDVRVAYFQADMGGEVTHVRLPPGMCEPCKVARLLRPLCGTRQAAKLFAKTVRRVLCDCGLGAKQFKGNPAVYFSADHDLLISVHGDDFLSEAEPEALDRLY